MPTMIEHELKTWPTPFDAMWHGDKLYELRRDDRGFQVGHTLLLREWVPVHNQPCAWFSPFDEQQTEQSDFRCQECGRKKDGALPGHYTGRWIKGSVTTLTQHGNFPGLERGFVILGVRIGETSAGEPAR